MPATEALEKARAQITEIFGPEASKATKPEQKTALARKMLGLAGENKSNPAEEYALLDAARKLLIAAADVRQAMSAATRLTDRFADPDWSIRTATLDALSSATLLPQDREALAGHCLQALDAAIEAQKFDLADEYSLLATKVASKLKDVETRKQVTQRRTEMVKLKQEVSAYDAALATLKQMPDDPAANLAAGKFLCFTLHDWEAGRPHLVKGGQPDLRRRCKAISPPTKETPRPKLPRAMPG